MGRLLRGTDRVGLLSVLRALARIHVI
jgi:hypothetical protein